MISRFVKLKTYKALMIGIHKELSPFFNFKELGILFYDREKEKFFSQQLDPLQIASLNGTAKKSKKKDGQKGS